MPLRVRILPAAQAVLDQLLRVWAERSSVETALRRYAGLRERLGLLGEYPQLGRSREEWGSGYRAFSFDRSITVAYRIMPRAVYVVEIFVRGQDPFWEDADEGPD